MKALISLLALPMALCALLPVRAQSGSREARSIADTIIERSGGKIRVLMDDGVARIVRQDTTAFSSRRSLAEAATVGYGSGDVVYRSGYRIQVYSDSKQRTAKAQAQRIATEIAKSFPDYGLYLAYKSPYWRLRVGDFISRDEADSALAELKARFPSMASEMRVVRDKVKHFE